MLKHLISLVFLLFSLSYLPALSDTNLKLLPKSKPKILTIKNEKKISIILPKKKPNINPFIDPLIIDQGNNQNNGQYG